MGGLGVWGEGGLGRKVSKLFVGLGGWEGLVGWLLAPSTRRLPREGGSLERAAPSRGCVTPEPEGEEETLLRHVK